MFGNIPRAREGLRRSMATRAPYDDPRLSIEDAVATGPDGSEVPVRLYRPTGAQGPLPAVLFFHGGGFVLGDLDGHSAGACLCAGLTLRPATRAAPPSPSSNCCCPPWTTAPTAAPVRRSTTPGSSTGTINSVCPGRIVRRPGHGLSRRKTWRHPYRISTGVTRGTPSE